MKRKLVLKTEKLRVLSETRLDGIAGGKGGLSLTVMQDGCATIFSQASICVGSKG